MMENRISGRPRLTNFILNSCLVIVSVALTYVGMEGAYRVYIYPHVRDQLTQLTRASINEGPWYKFDAHTGFLYTPNLSVANTIPNTPQYGGSFRTNEYGLIRNDIDPSHYDMSKPSLEFRVAVLGDSMTAGVLNRIRWPDLVQDYLNHSAAWRGFVGGKFTRVINFALDGTGVVQFAPVYEFRARQFSPDLVIADLILDDVTRKFVFRGKNKVDLGNDADIRAFVESDLMGLLPWYGISPELFIATIGHRFGLRQKLTAGRAYNLYRDSYMNQKEGLQKTIHSLNQIRCTTKNFFALYHPEYQELSTKNHANPWPPGYFLTGLRDKLFAAAKENDLPLVDIAGLNDVPDDIQSIQSLYNFPIDTHNSNFGLAVYAYWVFRYLLQWSQSHPNETAKPAAMCR